MPVTGDFMVGKCASGEIYIHRIARMADSPYEGGLIVTVFPEIIQWTCNGDDVYADMIEFIP
jgi:hypothetical protein